MTSSTNLHVCLISSYFIHFNIKSYSSSTSLLSPCVSMKDHRDHRAAQYIPGDGYGYLLYGGCQVSSIWGRTKPHLRWWSYRKWRHRKWRHGSMFCACPDFPALFSSYYSSTSNMATGSDQRSRDPCGVPLGVRMRNRKLGNIRPSGAFWPEVTLWNVTPSGFPWVRCAHAWSEVPLRCSLGRPCLSYSSPYHYLPLSRNFISTFNNGLHLLCFRIYTPSSLSRPHCIFVIFSEILTFLASFL